MKKLQFILVMLVLALPMTGCVGIAVEGVRMADSQLTRDKYLYSAEQGNAESQYQIGESYCCSPGDSDNGFYNNQLATEYLCKAAIQGHPLAALKLGKIHSGDRIDGVRLLRRAALAVSGSDTTNLQIAAYWLTQSKEAGNEEAAKLLATLPPQDITSLSDNKTVPCTMSQVYGG